MNLNQTFSILFRIHKARITKQGLAPIWVRITVDGKRSECSTQKQIYPKFWDAENNKVSEKFSEAKSINDYLTLIKADLLRHYNILLSTKDFVTADDVKNSYKGVKEIKKTFLQLFKQFNQQLTERKEIDDLSEGRHKRFGSLAISMSSYGCQLQTSLEQSSRRCKRICYASIFSRLLNMETHSLVRTTQPI